MWICAAIEFPSFPYFRMRWAKTPARIVWKVTIAIATHQTTHPMCVQWATTVQSTPLTSTNTPVLRDTSTHSQVFMALKFWSSLKYTYSWKNLSSNTLLKILPLSGSKWPPIKFSFGELKSNRNREKIKTMAKIRRAFWKLTRLVFNPHKICNNLDFFLTMKMMNIMLMYYDEKSFIISNLYLLGMKALSDCKACTPGYYCQGDGNFNETGLCDEGWYCTNASTRAKVCTCWYTEVYRIKVQCTDFLYNVLI